MKNWNEKIDKNLVPKINPVSQITNRRFREWDFEKSEKIIEKCVTLIKNGSYKEINKPIYKFGSYCKNGYRFFFKAKYLSGYCIEEKTIKKVKLPQPLNKVSV